MHSTLTWFEPDALYILNTHSVHGNTSRHNGKSQQETNWFILDKLGGFFYHLLIKFNGYFNFFGIINTNELTVLIILTILKFYVRIIRLYAKVKFCYFNQILFLILSDKNFLNTKYPVNLFLSSKIQLFPFVSLCMCSIMYNLIYWAHSLV